MCKKSSGRMNFLTFIVVTWSTHRRAAVAQPYYRTLTSKTQFRRIFYCTYKLEFESRLGLLKTSKLRAPRPRIRSLHPFLTVCLRVRPRVPRAALSAPNPKSNPTNHPVLYFSPSPSRASTTDGSFDIAPLLIE